jgi:hypothetical protein
MQWGNILLTELLFIFGSMIAFGFLKLPAFLRRRRLAKGFPWGYYPDQVPQTDPGFFNPNDHDFMHDQGTGFGGLEGFGDYGEFTGFGELGEFGAGFGFGVDAGSGGGGGGGD